MHMQDMRKPISRLRHMFMGCPGPKYPRSTGKKERTGSGKVGGRGVVLAAVCPEGQRKILNQAQTVEKAKATGHLY